jgi:hypothetical protein
MSGATGQLLSVQSRIKEKLVQRNQERKVRNGNLRTNDSTKPSDTPSRPVTRYRLLKMFAVASCIRFDAGTFIGELPIVVHPGNFD